jgi:hypothetical protein
LLSNPVSVANTRLILRNSNSPCVDELQSSNVAGALCELVETEGLRTLGRGLWPRLLKVSYSLLKYSLVLKYLTLGTKISNEHWTYFRVQPLADSPSLSTNFPSRGCRFHTLANKWGNQINEPFECLMILSGQCVALYAGGGEGGLLTLDLPQIACLGIAVARIHHSYAANITPLFTAFTLHCLLMQDGMYVHNTP